MASNGKRIKGTVSANGLHLVNPSDEAAYTSIVTNSDGYAVFAPGSGMTVFQSCLVLENNSNALEAIADAIAIYSMDTAGIAGSHVASLALDTEESLLTGTYTANRAIPATINGTQVLLLCQINEAT